MPEAIARNLQCKYATECNQVSLPNRRTHATRNPAPNTYIAAPKHSKNNLDSCARNMPTRIIHVPTAKQKLAIIQGLVSRNGEKNCPKSENKIHETMNANSVA